MAKNARTEISVNERFKIVRSDTLNWQVFEFKTLKKQNNPNLKNREGKSDWVPLPSYFSNVENAISWIARKLEDNGEASTLEEYVKAIKASHRKLARELADALESMGA